MIQNGRRWSDRINFASPRIRE